MINNIVEGGTSILFKRARVISFGKFIPLSWWVPQKERAVLAVVSTFFWVSTILQASQKDASGASVLAFYGLGLFYSICVMANIGGGARASLVGYRRRWSKTEQPRALLQLFGILGSMLVFNAVVLAVYLEKGAALTPLDMASIIIALITLSVIYHRYGWRKMFKHPFARGYMAIACKAMPQVLLAGVFVLQPAVAAAFTIWSLGSLALLAGLRFWPSLLAFKRDHKSKYMQGLMLGEAANMVSILLMFAAWGTAAL